MDAAETNVIKLSAHVDDIAESGKGEVGEAMRPFYLDYLRRHDVKAP